MKKRILKISALILALVLIAGVCVFANSLIGNPVSMALAKKTAEKYIEENYADKKLTVEDVTYSFKDGYYHANVIDEENIDGHFTLMMDSFGKLREDDYADRVTGGWNIAYRINDEYRKKVDSIFESQTFSYDAHIGFGDIEFISRKYKNESVVPEYAFVTEELTAGKIYDVFELGAAAGKLTMYIDNDTVTADKMAQILLDTKKLFDEAGVGFYAIDCVLETPKGENGFEYEERIEVLDFLYSDIYEDGLSQRITEADKAAKEYYAAQDMEKLEEY